MHNKKILFAFAALVLLEGCIDEPTYFLNIDKAPTTTVTETTARTFRVLVGSVDGGDINSTRFFSDNAALAINETTGSPAFTIDFNFIGISNFNRIVTRFFYTGTANHPVNFELYNFDENQFDTILNFSDLDEFASFAIVVEEDASYIGSDGNVSLRFTHPDNGNVNHDFNVEYIAIWNVPSGAGLTVHSDLSGLAWSVAGHSFDVNIDLGDNNISASFYFGDGSNLTGISTAQTEDSTLDTNSPASVSYRNTPGAWTSDQNYTAGNAIVFEANSGRYEVVVDNNVLTFRRFN